jgi:hypothetical protein
MEEAIDAVELRESSGGVSLLLEYTWMEGRTHPSNCRIIVVIQLREKGLSAKIAPRAGKESEG